jgi:SAM-dependent methyltransferase
LQEIDCIICGTDEAFPYKEENGYRAVRCARCGLVYLSPRPMIDEMKALYEGQETKIDITAHLRRRDAKTAEARKSLARIRRHRAAGDLLEVGSAAGYFLWEARNAGFAVQGVDLTRQFVEFSREVLGVPVFEGTLRAAPFTAGSFDVVHMRNVLSHLAEPVDELRHLHRLLRSGGWLFLETGNVAELPAARAGELELPDHLFHFSEATLRRLLARTGFEVAAVERYALISRSAPVERLGRVFARRPATRRGSPPRPAPPSIGAGLPPSTLGGRWRGRLAQFVRYDVGAVLPGKGARCTLVAVGRKAAAGGDAHA